MGATIVPTKEGLPVKIILAILAASVTLLVGGQTIHATPSEKVRICHATASSSNPYASNDVNKSSINEVNNQYLNGHGDHSGDIIPPFTFGQSSFPGRNFSGLNVLIYLNGCRPLQPPTTTTGPPVATIAATTIPETTVAPTTVPETTVAPTTTEFIDPCIIDGKLYDEYILVDWPDNQGTTEWGFLTCSTVPPTTDPWPPMTTVGPDPTPPELTELPETGSEGWITAAIASAMLAAGGVALATSRRD